MIEIKSIKLPSIKTKMGLIKFGLETILIASILYLVVRSVLGLVEPQSLWEPSAQRIGNTAKANMLENSNRAVRFDFSQDPFHLTPVRVEPSIGSDAPETTLNLKLFGRRTGPIGSAILETPDRVQGVFKVGDEIINGVTLKSVTADYIVLSRNGTLERLTFERNPESLLLAPEIVSVTEPLNPALANAQFSQINIAQLLESVSLKPVMQSGKSRQIKGFEVRALSDSFDLSEFGLKDGDIITKIGDNDMTQGAPNLALIMSQVSTGQPMNLSVLRGGRALTIDLGTP